MKDRALIYLILSIALHFVFILSFFQKIHHAETSRNTLQQSDSLFYMAEGDSAFTSDSIINNTEFDNDIYFERDSADPAQLSALQSEITRYYDGKFSGSGGSFIGDILSGKVPDSLLAMSELLRRAALKQLLKQLNDRNTTVNFDSDTFSKWLKELLNQQATNSKNAPPDEMIENIVSDQELMKLWEELVMKSIMEIGLDKLKHAIAEAMCDAKKQCFGRKPGDSPVSSFGNGGTIFGAEPDEEFIRKFRNRFKELSGPYLSLISSLMGEDELSQFLYGQMVGYLSGGNSFSESQLKNLAEKFDFDGMIRDAISKQQRSAMQARQFFDTFEHGFGKEISDLLGKEGILDEEGKLSKNRIVDFAENYLSLLENLAENANMVMPDLEKYAQAALDIRNRKLKVHGLYELGRGFIASSDSDQFVAPEMITFRNTNFHHTHTTRDTGLCKASFFAHAWGGAPHTEQPVVLDGNLDEWKNASRFKLKGKRQGELPLPPEFQSCNFLLAQWDNRGFYFAYEINDTYDNPCNPMSFWDTDALELFFDPLNYKDSVRTTNRSFQFWVWPRLQRKWGYSGESVFLSPQHYEPRILREDGIQVASRRTGNRYTCEVLVSPHIMKYNTLMPGKIIGFNYSINNGENVYLRWVTNKGINISGHPNLWGDLLLMGSSAQLMVVPDTVILPGQSLRIKIVDYDMNFSYSKQDKVFLKVRSRRTGDFLPCTGIESGSNTGVFSTVVNTTFGIEAVDRQKLSVLPGDLLEIYYLDQHASGGRVNVPLKWFVHVGRGVFAFR
jgi:hypothetical protein